MHDSPVTPPALRCISSMATRQVLAELAAVYEAQTGQAVVIESVGGVDAAKRVAAGEVFDVVFLASDAIQKLLNAGHLQAGSRVDLLLSPVAVAVQAGAPQPDIGTEATLRAAVLAAPTIGYSTGPSGVFLTQLFQRWGLADTLAARTVQAPPGVPVGALVARGEVALGFQQLSELVGLPGISVLGTLPGDAAFITTFSAGLGQGGRHSAAAQALLAFLASPATAEAKRRHGMAPA